MANELYGSIGSGGSTFVYTEEYRRINQVPIDFGGLIFTGMDYDPETAQKTIDRLGLSAHEYTLIDHRDFRFDNGKLHPTAYGEKILEFTQRRGISQLKQNGATPMTPDNVIDALHPSNQHPALAHEIGGRGMVGAAPYDVAKRFAEVTGRYHTYVSIHEVGPELDKGAYLKVSGRIPFEPTDTVAQIQAKGKLVEWQLDAAHLENMARGTVHTIMVPNLMTHPGEEGILYGIIQQVRSEQQKGRH